MAAINSFAPKVVETTIPLTPDEIRIGLIGNSIVPTTMAIASFLIWLVFVRQPKQPDNLHLPTAAGCSGPAAPSQDEILDAYLITMTELLIASESLDPLARTDVGPVVYGHTRQALQQLGPSHRGRVIQFLQAAHFLRGDGRISLHEFDLSGIDLRFSDLRCANLSGVRLQGAKLTGALMYGANLTNASLDGADLRLAELDRSTLREANLSASKLHRASLRQATLQDAALDRANLWQADLTAADVADEQLQTALTVGALLPDVPPYS